MKRNQRYEKGDVFLAIDTLDAALVAPGDTHHLLDFAGREQPRCEGGMHVNLFNNLWGTRFGPATQHPAPALRPVGLYLSVHLCLVCVRGPSVHRAVLRTVARSILCAHTTPTRTDLWA